MKTGQPDSTGDSGSSVEQRRERGKDARRRTPLAAHASWEPSADRRDPVAVLEEQGRYRVLELIPIRYGRMVVSPFTFYRGAAAIMAADLAATARSELRAQLCGDAHLSNFGVFASPERSLVFDVNDFDETLPGPWEWDLKRLAASFEIASRERGFGSDRRREVVLAGVREYRERMRQAARTGHLGVWYAHLSVDEVLQHLRADKRRLLSRRDLAAVEQNMAKSRTRDSMNAYSKLTDDSSGQRRIRADPPLIVPIEDLVPEGARREEIEQFLRGLLASYQRSLQPDRQHLLSQFRLVHLARKVVGVGSVGSRSWIVLMLGRDDTDPLLLQAKQVQPSVLEPFAGASRYQQQGERVVAGQRLMQAASDIFLGWQRVTDPDGRPQDYYLRQLRDWKGSLDVERMSVSALTLYARLCAATLARAHARTGDRIAIASYLGKQDTFDRALADFATAYADQNERDYQALLEAVSSGRVQAQTGL